LYFRFSPGIFGNLFTPRMSVKFNVCFVLGGPGAGKGTVCEKIVQDYEFMHLSAGELLRQACNTAGSTYGEQIERHMKAGTIVPAKITCGLLHQVCVDRCMKRHHGRIDDNEDTLKRRIRQFKEQCLPIIEYYEARSLVSRIDGSKTKDEVS
ncbi:UMP-CMP kinase, partial [Paragonimus westermani]